MTNPQNKMQQAAMRRKAPVPRAKIKRTPPSVTNMPYLIEQMPMGVLIYRAEGISYANLAAHRLFGIEKLEGWILTDLVDPIAARSLELALVSAHETPKPMTISMRLNSAVDVSPEVRQRVLELHITPNVGGENGRSSGELQIIVCDITEREQMASELHRLSKLDSLTMTQRRGSFIRYFNDVSVQARDTRSALIVLDIDHFKRINDLHGYACGDAALRQLVIEIETYLARMNLCPDLGDKAEIARAVLARVGGEAFAIFAPSMNCDAAMAFADEVRAVISRSIVRFNGFSLALTASFGVSGGRLGVCDFDTMMRTADSALFKAKSQGRNRVCFLDAESSVPIVSRRVARSAPR